MPLNDTINDITAPMYTPYTVKVIHHFRDHLKLSILFFFLIRNIIILIPFDLPNPSLKWE